MPLSLLSSGLVSSSKQSRDAPVAVHRSIGAPGVRMHRRYGAPEVRCTGGTVHRYYGGLMAPVNF